MRLGAAGTELFVAFGEEGDRGGVGLRSVRLGCGNHAVLVAHQEQRALELRGNVYARDRDALGLGELLAAVNNGELAFVAPADECLCGTATLIEQLAQTKGIPVARVDIPAQLKGALFLVSDEHGVVPATETDAAEADAATVAFFAEGYENLRARRS